MDDASSQPSKGTGSEPRRRATGVLRTSLGVAASAAFGVPAAWQVATLARLFAKRLTYPMALDWLESGYLYQAVRMAHGERVYGPPNAGYLPHAKPPAFFALLALLERTVGLDYWDARVVSIGFFLLCVAVIGWILYRRCVEWPARWLLPLGSVGFLAATVPVAQGWYDVARVDTMALALVLLGGTLAEAGRGVGSGAAAGAILAVALFTKQTCVFFLPWIVLCAAVRDRRRALVLVAALGGLSGTAFGLLQWSTHGWFWFWISSPASHGLRWSVLARLLLQIVRFVPFAPAIPLLLVFSRRRRSSPRLSIFWLGMLVSAGPASLLPLMKVGGANNNLMPLIFIGWLVSVLVVADFIDAVTSSARPHRALCWGAQALLALHVASHRLDPTPLVPRAALRAAVERLNTEIADLKGTVLIPSHPFLATRNGHHESQISAMGYLDARWAQRPTDVETDLQALHPQWILLTSDEIDQWLLPQLAKWYVLSRVIGSPVAYDPRLSQLPRYLYRRVDPPHSAPTPGEWPKAEL